MASDEIPVTIRQATVEDHPLIKDSWLQTAAYHCPQLFFVTRGSVFNNLSSAIDTLLAKRLDLFRVAANKDEPDQIFGWSCTQKSPAVTHFCYVKQRFRKKWGIAGMLLHNSGAGRRVVSWWSRSCNNKNLEYNPDYLRRLYNAALQGPACETRNSDQLVFAEQSGHRDRERKTG